MARRLGLVLLGVMSGLAFAARPAAYGVYVTNERSGTLSVIDGGSGKVVASPARKTEINVSSKERVKAKIAPVTTAERSCGQST